MSTNFAGLTELLCQLGFHCRTTNGESLSQQLPGARLVVVPPPTGTYDARKERWRRERFSLFTNREITELLSSLREGGRLLAFAYRFGDSFTQTNLGELFSPLGCQLNDDAVIDAGVLRCTHPLQMHFDTPRESLPQGWSRERVSSVRWRPMATFSILSGATAWPLALSTGGRCLSFNRTLGRISFEPLPIAVIGRSGAGRFVLVGGPHAFETSPLGLLGCPDNIGFLKNILHWLLHESPSAGMGSDEPVPVIGTPIYPTLAHVESWGEGHGTIASVERILRRTGVLKALNRARWMP